MDHLGKIRNFSNVRKLGARRMKSSIQRVPRTNRENFPEVETTQKYFLLSNKNIWYQQDVGRRESEQYRRRGASLCCTRTKWRPTATWRWRRGSSPPPSRRRCCRRTTPTPPPASAPSRWSSCRARAPWTCPCPPTGTWPTSRPPSSSGSPMRASSECSVFW